MSFLFAAQSWGVLVYENLHALNILTKGSLLDTLSDRECRLVLALMVRESYKVRTNLFIVLTQCICRGAKKASDVMCTKLCLTPVSVYFLSFFSMHPTGARCGCERWRVEARLAVDPSQPHPLGTRDGAGPARCVVFLGILVAAIAAGDGDYFARTVGHCRGTQEHVRLALCRIGTGETSSFFLLISVLNNKGVETYHIMHVIFDSHCTS